MQFLLLIYDDEKRWTNLGKPDYGSELDQYRAFGKEFAKAIQGGNALQPTAAAKTVRVRNGKVLATALHDADLHAGKGKRSHA